MISYSIPLQQSLAYYFICTFIHVCTIRYLFQVVLHLLVIIYATLLLSSSLSLSHCMRRRVCPGVTAPLKSRKIFVFPGVLFCRVSRQIPKKCLLFFIICVNLYIIWRIYLFAYISRIRTCILFPMIKLLSIQLTISIPIYTILVWKQYHFDFHILDQKF